MSATRHREPVSLPDPTYCSVPALPPALTSEEEAKVEQVHQHFAAAGFELADGDGSEAKRGLDELEKMYLSREMFRRFLVAQTWDTEQAIKRLEACMLWRRTSKIYDIEAMATDLEDEFANAKTFVYGYTVTGEPIIYFRFAKINTQPSPRQTMSVMFMCERLTDLMCAGVETLVFLGDFTGRPPTSWGSIQVARQVLQNLQDFYPERLGSAQLTKIPWLGSILLNIIWPFVDPYTKTKVVRMPDLTKGELIPLPLLTDEYGGHAQFDFDTKTYLSAITKLCLERRDQNLARWRKAGGQVGLSELDFLPQFPALTIAANTNTK